ncbi:hypothetical protein [Pinirhizobacter sp.]|jgi:hypothetical protein|uniref:hypothetical protein n=1 Tax=Pinirhizobacter sp. TaxID=2950432 RepID=UPI002F3F3B16
MTLSDIVLIVVVVGVIGAVIRFWPKKMPKERAFRCKRCHAVTTHTSRTIEAWRSGKTQFYCDACHSTWHVNRTSAHGHHVRARAGGARGKGGCFAMVVGLVVLPVLAVTALLVRWA